MKKIDTPKHKRTRILHILSDSVPQTVRFSAEVDQGDNSPSGLIEVERTFLFFAHRKEEHKLRSENSLRKGMFDTTYAVFVVPDEDTKIAFQTRHFSSRWLFWALGLVLAAGLAAGLIPMIIRASS